MSKKAGHVRLPLDLYLRLPLQQDKCQVTYVWLDGSGWNLRAKTRTLDFNPKNIQDIPIWNFNGSSTWQAELSNSDVYLFPIGTYNDPFHLGNSKLALCEAYRHNRRPAKTNKRVHCSNYIKKKPDPKVLFAFEEKVSAKYSRLQTQGSNFIYSNLDQRQRLDYSSNELAEKSLSELHLQACLYAGIKISELRNELGGNEWSYLVGPSEAVALSDDTWMARYILHRIAEELNVTVSMESSADPRLTNQDNFLKFLFTHPCLMDSSTNRVLDELIESITRRQKEELELENAHVLPSANVDSLMPKANLEEFFDEDSCKYTGVAVPWPLVSYDDDDIIVNNSDPYEVTMKILKSINSVK